MAAIPPQPPGNFLKSLFNPDKNNKNPQHSHQQANDENEELVCNSSAEQLEAFTNCNTTQIELSATAATAKKKANCNCSNISIMHLFHEMKQEFPTIPDTIVAQCVNENCHQRENCMQVLRNEFELNPIPAQSYPAKVLHPPNNKNSNNTTNTANNLQKPLLQQKPLVVQQKPPLKPIKPIRTAPLQPPTIEHSHTKNSSNNNNNNNNNNICTKLKSTLSKNTTTKTNKPLCDENVDNNNDDCSNKGVVESTDISTKITPQKKPLITTNTEVNNNDEICMSENVERNLPRQRPTTLNLNAHLQKQQQQQRQLLNIQLQQRFQEQQNQQQFLQTQNHAIVAKPIRKAPLPPIAPKPSHLQHNNINTNANALNSFHYDTLLTNQTTKSSPLSDSEISVSVSVSTPSSTPLTNTAQQPFNSLSPLTSQKHHHQQHLQTKSPIRHRSVISLQPEPPYARDFITPSAAVATTIQTSGTNSSSSASSSPTASVAGSHKSFTSLNLTLRPPISPTCANPSLQPATIDITAGPGFSGASGGGKSLHYSSTSYDARLGYQQNFQITVTDKGGVFSACRLRPQSQQQHCLNKQQQQQLQLQHQQQFNNNNVVALQQNIQNSSQSPYGIGDLNLSTGFSNSPGTSTNISGNMRLPQQAMYDSTQEALQRQIKRRDKLAAALREYKKRLGNVEQEINLLTGTIPTEGLCERLDDDITKLRRDCQDMLRSSSTFTQPISQQELAINYQPQPFPRERITHPPSRPPPPRHTSLDIIQHHSQTSTPHTPPAPSFPNLTFYNLPQQQLILQQQQQHLQRNHVNSLASPPYYYEQLAPVTDNININHNYTNADHEEFVEDNGDHYDDEYEEVVEPWECNMCTFRNHPQLNICETCENVRIIPGRLTNLSRALSAANCTSTANTAAAGVAAVSPNLNLLRRNNTAGGVSNNANNSGNGNVTLVNGNLEHDTNLIQQQLQHFALHT